ncbi:MAG TPA: formate dehydrogenase subunit gamma [Usitatibacter sp.]|nr:formate dehydrogenase subunit gamma [Usitatibacter sp.]
MSDVQRDASGNVQFIERYASGLRITHWLLAACFLLAALSGLALFHPAMAWLVALFGGGPWTRILHPFFGIAMVAVFAYLALRLVSENFLREHDYEWLRHGRDVFANRHGSLPEQGKYNAGQKVLYWLLVLLMLTLLVTGFLFWRPWFAPYFPITLVRLGTLVHSAAAAILIIVVIGHIYMAIWTVGSIRAMVQGYVTARWAKYHHALWYREVTKERP